MREQPNINALWGALIVEELIRHGVERFVIAPGSRSAPLVAAVARSRASATVWLDERGAGFHALGLARGSGMPAAVVTTSGTAVANLLPAVVEAATDGVPLILLTADRPPELRDVGANQTIEQRGIFGDFPRWSFDLPCPDDRLPARMVLTTVDEAVRRALREAGPVQLNCPFREPLAPDPARWGESCLEGLESWGASAAPFTRTELRPGRPDPAAVEEVAIELARAENGLLVTGAARWNDRAAVRELVEALGWPWLTDVRSQLRFGTAAPLHLPHLDRLFAADRNRWRPDVVLQVGGSLTSKRLQAFLDRGDASHHILIDDRPHRLDPGHRVTRRIDGAVGPWCQALADAVAGRVKAPSIERLRAVHERLESAMEAVIDAGGSLTEPWVARWLTRHIQPDHSLFLSSSLPVREADDYGALDAPSLRVAANRGASGIDGVIASAAGFASGSGRPCTLLIGDLAFLHDLNALAMLVEDIPALTIVVLNNGGGGIFAFLPIAEHDVFSPLFDTPHEFRFDGVCRDFGLRYARAETRPDFEDAYGAVVTHGGHAVIEVASDIKANREAHRRIEAALREALSQA